MTSEVHELLAIEQANAEAVLRGFLRPYIRRAEKLGFKMFFSVEPVTIVANGTEIQTREITVRFQPESAKARVALKQNGDSHYIEAMDRYVDLKDFEQCLAGVLEVGLETAAQAV